MIRLVAATVAFAFLTITGAAAQDARSVVRAASAAMGVDATNAIHYYGVAENGSLGQNNNANQPWPVAAANNYVRAIDFTRPASRATWSSYALTAQGGPPTAMTPGQQTITPQNLAWAQQLEIWTTPWGFLKGAASMPATARTETVGGRTLNVVTWNSPLRSPGGAQYRLVGYISPDNMVERVQTWLEILCWATCWSRPTIRIIATATG